MWYNTIVIKDKGGKKVKNKFVKFLLEACVIYTAVGFSMNLILLIQYAAAETGANFSSLRSILFLPCALCLSAATSVRISERLGGVVRWLLHAFLCVCGLFFFAVLPGLGEQTGAQKLVGFFITLLVYLVIVLLVSTVFRRVKRAEKESQRYKKKF